MEHLLIIYGHIRFNIGSHAKIEHQSIIIYGQILDHMSNMEHQIIIFYGQILDHMPNMEHRLIIIYSQMCFNNGSYTKNVTSINNL